MTYGQLGWVDGVGFSFALILEIPSGAVADLLGKRKTILLGAIAGAIGVFLITFSGNLTWIFIGWVIAQINFAFYSGAAEALAYDTLVDVKEEEKFDHVITRSSEIASYASAGAVFIGGLLYEINFQIPHFLWALSFVLSAAVAYFLIEPRTDTEKFSWSVYRKQLVQGFRELTQTELRTYMGFFLALVGVYFIYSWGFVRPAIATSFGFFSKEQGVLLPLLTLSGAFVVRAVPFLRRKVSNLTGFMILSAIMALGFFIAAFPVGYYGIFALILIMIAGKLADPWISIIVNKKIESKYRATTISTVALITKIPYVLIAVVAGKMIENGQLPTFNFITAGTILVVALGSFFLIKVRKSLS